ncbi:MAG: prolyl oligopeptidase family serine peptidase [Archangium sp.]|nr:prolyl oligopeptidase family serine peptidase [Archangium sp.]
MFRPSRSSLLTLPFVVLACAHVGAAPVDPELKPGTITVDGRERKFLHWDAGKGAPLVLSLHGRAGTIEGQEKLAGLMPIAKREKFTLVIPAGMYESWHDARDFGPSAEEGVDDVKFISTLIDEFVAKHGVDPQRVYVLGMSNGGFMTLTLACRLSEKFAGAAAITGQVAKKLEADCPMTKPVPIALFLGTEDPLVPFKGGMVARVRGETLSATGSAEFLAKKNGCAGEPKLSALPDVDPNDGTKTTLTRYEAGCRAPVNLYVIEGGGHTWPGGWQYAMEKLIGKTSRDLNASEASWAFFKTETK